MSGSDSGSSDDEVNMSGSSSDDDEANESTNILDEYKENQPSTSQGCGNEKVPSKPRGGFKIDVKPKANKRRIPPEYRQTKRWTKKPRKTPKGFTAGQANACGYWYMEQAIGKKVEDGETFYLIKWKEWPFCASTWEPAEHLKDNFKNGCEAKIRRFEKFEEMKKSALPTSGDLGINLELETKEYDPKGIKTDFPDKMEIDEIQQMFKIKDEICFLVKLKPKEGSEEGSNEGTKDPAEEAKEPQFNEEGQITSDNFIIMKNHSMRSDFPDEVIEFYENRIKWFPRPADKEIAKDESESEDQDSSNVESEVSGVSGDKTSSGEEDNGDSTGNQGDSTGDSEEDSGEYSEVEESEDQSSDGEEEEGEEGASDSDSEDN